ncbi:sugar transferase [Candidatus Pelagibacter bacterium nBUS_49]|uniref:sugar transferase n=1 Tax=Candidatus Pelagibacter bacterium nBUS_49 TaxID=3374196 RepID=UPI003EBD29CB
MIRFFDISISILSLLVLLPLLVIISSLILMIEGRPIIFKQNRIGRGGKKFVIYKFRTMSNIKYKNEEQRLSNFGKILRKTSLDEIPQLLNVLKNNMSIVGPRPLPESTERKINKILKKKEEKFYLVLLDTHK